MEKLNENQKALLWVKLTVNDLVDEGRDRIRTHTNDQYPDRRRQLSRPANNARDFSSKVGLENLRGGSRRSRRRSFGEAILSGLGVARHAYAFDERARVSNVDSCLMR
jgi:hypothetical protein